MDMVRRATRPLVLLASLLWSFPSFGQQLEQYAHNTTPNFPKLPTIRAEAEGGNAKAQAKLGDYYRANSDFTNAVVWYRKAAEQGETDAQFSLASCYLAGQGVAKNSQEAAKWLRAAATQLGQAQGTRENSRRAEGNAVPAASGQRETATVPAAAVPTAATPPVIDVENFSRVQRTFTVRPSEPQLQELPQPWRLQRAAP
jgi:hypothetical protein